MGDGTGVSKRHPIRKHNGAGGAETRSPAAGPVAGVAGWLQRAHVRPHAAFDGLHLLLRELLHRSRGWVRGTDAEHGGSENLGGHEAALDGLHLLARQSLHRLRRMRVR